MTSTTFMNHDAGIIGASEKTRALLADLWRRNRPTIEMRLDTLDRAASAVPLTESLQAEALDVAHKLAGSLGMFGFERGTVISRELETILDGRDPDTDRLAELTSQLRAMLLTTSEDGRAS